MQVYISCPEVARVILLFRSGKVPVVYLGLGFAESLQQDSLKIVVQAIVLLYYLFQIRNSLEVMWQIIHTSLTQSYTASFFLPLQL